MSEATTIFGHILQPRPSSVTSNAKRGDSLRVLGAVTGQTTGSMFAPMQLERRILLVLLPLMTAAFTGVWISSMVMGPATWIERYLVGLMVPSLALTLLWTLKCSPGQLWKPRTALLGLMGSYISLRFMVGLWITTHEGYSTGVMRDLFPPMLITSLFCVFLIPGRRGAQTALGYFAINALALVAFLILNPIPLDPNIAEDMILSYGVGHFFIIIMAIIFARLRVAYGRTLAKAEDLQAMALEDALTGILNRRAFSLAFKRARARFHRNRTPMSVLLLDIDHFKQINDTLGHDVGDHALRSLAGMLLSDLRRMDEVFRCGGEEFLILLEETPLQPAWEIAERIRKKIKRANLIHDRTLTVSIGVAELADFESEVEIFKRADMALYEAKHQGRDKVCVAHPPQEDTCIELAT